MFDYFYNILIRFVAFILPILSPFSKKLKYFNNERVKGPLLKKKKVRYWFHCASLGEYEMALPIIENMAHKWGQANVLITFFSPSGFTYAVEGKYEEEVRYLPLDTKANVEAFYNQFEIINAVFVRYDLWYNFIKIGLAKHINFYILNARFAADHKIFSKKGRRYLDLVSQFKHVFCSDEETDQAFKNNGLKNSLYVGDTRFERVAKITRIAQEMPDIEAFISEKNAICLGSSWPREEELGLELLQSGIDLKMMIAPHNVSPDRIEQIATLFGDFKPKKYSQGNFGKDDQVLIIDNIGMLAKVYRYSNVALVGGGFSGALHNIMEPAAWGNFVYFGPDYSKFPEAKLFIDNGIAKSIENKNEWISDVTSFLASDEKIQLHKKGAEEFIVNSRTALMQIITRLH